MTKKDMIEVTEDILRETEGFAEATKKCFEELDDEEGEKMSKELVEKTKEVKRYLKRRTEQPSEDSTK